jgi:hypothetical protein
MTQGGARMTRRATGRCKGCPAVGPLTGRELCSRCYYRHWTAGTLDQFPSQREPFDPNSHGLRRYSSRGHPCTCEVCRAAKAAHMRAQRAEAAQLRAASPGPYVAPGITHGISGYKDSGCRCPVCRAAKAAEYARSKAGR